MGKDMSPVIKPAWGEVKFLEGQTAVVTGASSGIGMGIARELGRAGANVVANYRSEKKDAEELVEEIKDFGSGAIAYKADVSDEEEVKSMFAKAREEFGTVDILINNAGLQQDAPFDEMTLEQWNKVINVNLTGQFLCAREAVREFKRRGVQKEVSVAAGKIICISSVHEVVPWAGHVNYAASKGGIMLMMKSIAQETARDKIRVNSIAPGAIKTSINEQAWKNEDAAQKTREKIPYNRIGDTEDIGRVAVWLASDYSDYITGTTILVDGGMSLYPGFEHGGG